jgi:uncharacterized OB-fold protein
MRYSAPRNGREATPHWKAAREGRLLLPFCTTHHHFCWPPARRCPACHSPVEWKESGGAGVVETFSIVRRAVQPEWKDKEPYVVAFVRLDDGGRLFSNIVDCAPESVRCGARVTCCFVETTDPELGLPVFRLAPPPPES